MGIESNTSPFDTPEHEVNNELLKELRSLYSHAREVQDPVEQKALIEKFYLKLLRAVTPGEKAFDTDQIEHVADVVINGGSPGYLSVGGGTAGQRILFQDYAFVTTEEAKQYGTDVKKMDMGDGTIELSTLDRKVRWMVYPEPETFGKEYWEKFQKVFGKNIVDLLEKEI